MRLISKFHDYYDAAQSHGVDLTRVYVRQALQVPNATQAVESALGNAKAFLSYALGVVPGTKRLGQANRDEVLEELTFGIVLFAGRLYPFCRANVRDRRSMTSRDSIHYDYKSLCSAVKPFGVELDEKSQRQRDSWMFSRSRPLQPFFALKGSEAFSAKATEDALSIAAYSRQFDMLEVNPRLADYEFYKVLDAWQAYQELEMFVGNIAAPDRVVTHISDKDRVLQHGFDHMSFRKYPER